MAPLLLGQDLLFCSMRSKSSVWRYISLWISCKVVRILFSMTSSMVVPPFFL